MGVGGQRQAPAALSPGMTRYPLYRRLGGPQGRSGRVLKISPPPGFDPQCYSIYCVGSTFKASVTADVPEMHIKRLLARAQCFSSYPRN
jgi:hypothetical protein